MLKCLKNVTTNKTFLPQFQRHNDLKKKLKTENYTTKDVQQHRWSLLIKSRYVQWNINGIVTILGNISFGVLETNFCAYLDTCDHWQQRGNFVVDGKMCQVTFSIRNRWWKSGGASCTSPGARLNQSELETLKISKRNNVSHRQSQPDSVKISFMYKPIDFYE